MNRLECLGRLFLGMLLVLALWAAGTGRGLAAVQSGDVSLGGVYPGMTYEEIIACYGTPTKELRGDTQLVHKVIFYGDDVEIGFCGEKVLYVTVTADNGWRTPQGLHAGMGLDEAISICGQDYKRFEPNKYQSADRSSPFFERRWNGVRYVYRCAAPDGVYSYVPGDTTWGISLLMSSGGAAKVEAVSVRAYVPES